MERFCLEVDPSVMGARVANATSLASLLDHEQKPPVFFQRDGASAPNPISYPPVATPEDEQVTNLIEAARDGLDLASRLAPLDERSYRRLAAAGTQEPNDFERGTRSLDGLQRGTLVAAAEINSLEQQRSVDRNFGGTDDGTE